MRSVDIGQVGGVGGNWVKWGVLTLVRWVGEGVIGSSGECSLRSGGLGRGVIGSSGECSHRSGGRGRGEGVIGSSGE